MVSNLISTQVLIWHLHWQHQYGVWTVTTNSRMVTSSTFPHARFPSAWSSARRDEWSDESSGLLKWIIHGRHINLGSICFSGGCHLGSIKFVKSIFVPKLVTHSPELPWLCARLGAAVLIFSITPEGISQEDVTELNYSRSEFQMPQSCDYYPRLKGFSHAARRTIKLLGNYAMFTLYGTD